MYPPELFALYRSHTPLESGSRVARVTNQTSDDFRFVRAWWEVPSNDRWRPYAKGGEYAPYYSDLHLVVDWDSTRNTYKGYVGTEHRPDVTPASFDYFFRPGITYSHRTNSAFGPRVMPSGTIFSNKGPCVFANSENELLFALGVMMCRVFQGFVELRVGSGDSTTAGTPSRQYDVGVLKTIPMPECDPNGRSSIANHVRSIVHQLQGQDSDNEVSHAFLGYVRNGSSATLRSIRDDKNLDKLRCAREVLRLSGKIEQECRHGYGISENVYRQIATQVGVHPIAYPQKDENGVSTNEVAASLEKGLSTATSSFVAQRGGKRYVTVQCHTLIVALKYCLTFTAFRAKQLSNLK